MHIHMHTLGVSVCAYLCVFDTLMFSFSAITDIVVQFFESLYFKAPKDFQVSSVET